LLSEGSVADFTLDSWCSASSMQGSILMGCPAVLGEMRLRAVAAG
jgi:hypothetical protein